MTTTPAPAASPTSPAATAGEVLALIRSGRAATRGALGRATGLSRTAVNARLSALADAGLVLEGEEESATGGRPATTLVLNRDAGLVLAVAVGRSRSQLSVCALDGTELASASLDQETGQGPDVLMPWSSPGSSGCSATSVAPEGTSAGSGCRWPARSTPPGR
jgi:DNA-binding transcriptional ArsR family regulator